MASNNRGSKYINLGPDLNLTNPMPKPDHKKVSSKNNIKTVGLELDTGTPHSLCSKELKLPECISAGQLWLIEHTFKKALSEASETNRHTLEERLQVSHESTPKMPMVGDYYFVSNV